jgi:hypothetical protein
MQHAKNQSKFRKDILPQSPTPNNMVSKNNQHEAGSK